MLGPARRATDAHACYLDAVDSIQPGRGVTRKETRQPRRETGARDQLDAACHDERLEREQLGHHAGRAARGHHRSTGPDGPLRECGLLRPGTGENEHRHLLDEGLEIRRDAHTTNSRPHVCAGLRIEVPDDHAGGAVCEQSGSPGPDGPEPDDPDRGALLGHSTLGSSSGRHKPAPAGSLRRERPRRASSASPRTTSPRTNQRRRDRALRRAGVDAPISAWSARFEVSAGKALTWSHAGAGSRSRPSGTWTRSPSSSWHEPARRVANHNNTAASTTRNLVAPGSRSRRGFRPAGPDARSDPTRNQLRRHLSVSGRDRAVHREDDGGPRASGNSRSGIPTSKCSRIDAHVPRCPETGLRMGGVGDGEAKSERVPAQTRKPTSRWRSFPECHSSSKASSFHTRTAASRVRRERRLAPESLALQSGTKGALRAPRSEVPPLEAVDGQPLGPPRESVEHRVHLACIGPSRWG